MSRAQSRAPLAVAPLPPIDRAHLDALSDETGIWQFASGVVPHRSHGYCTDDVARALAVHVLHGRALGWAAVAAPIERDLTFLAEAFDAGTGRFRNMRGANREWIPGNDSEDCHARALLGLGRLMAWHREPRTTVDAGTLFFRALPAADDFGALRPAAAAILATAAAVDGGFEAAAPTFRALGERLAAAFAGLDADWPWPEDTVTYENALLPRALLQFGERSGERAVAETALHVLEWLDRSQTSSHGHFSPIGNHGWWPRGGERAQWDQQPIEAASMVLAAGDAFRATSDARYEVMARRAFGWFLGENDLGVAVADVARGGCHDGLGPNGANDNEGAESTISWLLALEAMRQLGR